MSARTAAADARVLDLDRHLAPVVQRRAVDLADRRRRDRLLVELLEDLVDRFFEVVLDHLAHLLEGDRRRGVAQLCELALELLAVLLGDEADVEERHHLSELHRGALHRPERGHDLLGGLQLAPRERLLGGLLAARHVRRARAELLDRLARRERRDGRRAPHARGRDLFALARHRSFDSKRARPATRPFSVAPLRCDLDARARHDVVGAVGPAHPGLRAAVVVGCRAARASPARRAPCTACEPSASRPRQTRMKPFESHSWATVLASAWPG